MRILRTAIVVAALGLPACGASEKTEPDSPTSGQLYMDIHELGPGNVTAEAVAKAHRADLQTQAAHGVSFLRYWVDEEHGVVYCLSRAPSAKAIVDTHREAHGLIPQTVGIVTAGQ